MTDFVSYIDAELLIVVPVLYVLGIWIKKIEKIPDNYIPLLLGGIGIVLTLLYVFATNDVTSANAFQIIFTSIVEGILEAAAAVYANQLHKQGMTESSGSGDPDDETPASGNDSDLSAQG